MLAVHYQVGLFPSHFCKGECSVKILIVTAHADDLEGGMGGLVVQLVEAGHDIISVVTTAGKRGQAYGDQPALHVRMTECIEACRRLGIIPLCLARYEEEYGITPETQAEFDALVHVMKPDVVFTHWPVDVHVDHRVCSALAMSSILKKGVNTEIFFHEQFSSGRYSTAYRPQSVAFCPTHYVDISNPDVLEAKRQLLFCHQSQDPEGMWRGKIDWHRIRGAEVGVTQAEVYIRATRWGELSPELAKFFIPTPFKLPRSIGVDFTAEAIGLTT